MSNLPNSLFKYLPPMRLDVLESLLIRFTQASSQNDTLELKPPTKGVAEPESLAHITRTKLTETMWSMTSVENKQLIDTKYPGWSEQIGEGLLQEYIPEAVATIEQNYEQSRQKLFEITDKNFGIFCLSEISDDIKMWGHYADGGRGFLLEFDTQHLWFHGKREDRDSFRHLRQVQYVSSRPATYLIETTEDDFLYTKWSAWQDEKEWRIIRCFNDAARKLEQLDPYGNEILLFSIPPDSIKSVILGYSADSKVDNKIRAILNQRVDLKHVQLQVATQSRDTGQVTIQN